MRCRERSGFLFAHRCSHPVFATCSQCNKPICKGHLRSRQGTPLCVTCYQQVAERPHAPGVTQPERGYYAYYDDPFWYASYHYSSYGYYDARDYGVFDGESDAAAADFGEDDWEAS